MARPNLDYLRNALLTFFGIPFGIGIGLSGISIAPALIPALGWLLGRSSVRLRAEALAMLAAAGAAALFSYGSHGDLPGRLLLTLFIAQVAGAICGGFLVRQLPAKAISPLFAAIIVAALGAGLLAAALHPSAFLLFKEPRSARELLLEAGAASFAAGLIGRAADLGGVLLVPLLGLLCHFTPAAAQGVALAIVALSCAPAALLNAARSSGSLRATPWLSGGAAIGALLGARWAVECRHPAALISAEGAALLFVALFLAFTHQESQEQV